MSKQEEGDYLYTSRKTGKTYETLSELQTAEEEYLKAQREKEKLSSEKSELSHRIEDAYSHYRESITKGNKELKETQSRVNEEIANAESEYEKLQDEWFKKGYGPFRMTYTDKDGGKAVLDEYHTTLTSYEKNLHSLVRSFFDLF